MLKDYLRDYDKSIVKRLFPNETIDFGGRFDDGGYSIIFLEDDGTPIAPFKHVFICYHNLSEEKRIELISNNESYITVEEFDPPIYKRYISKVYKITSNPSLEQRIENCQKRLEELENSTDEKDVERCEYARKRLQELLEFQASF